MIDVSNLNPYDSIGEFYLKKNQKEKVIEYYNKALRIDPNLESAKRMLEKISATTSPWDCQF